MESKSATTQEERRGRLEKAVVAGYVFLVAIVYAVYGSAFWHLAKWVFNIIDQR